MIVRIMEQGQYEVDKSLLDQLNAIDNRIVDHVNKEDENNFRKDLARLISLVKRKGDPLDPSKIVRSEIIIPPEDLTFGEAKKIFSGHGLIEG
jgi:hypothetical protein